MNHLLLDTCVWLNLADWRESEVLAAIAELLTQGKLTVVVPDIVLQEFTRNEDDVLSSRERAAKSHIKQVRALAQHLEQAEEQAELKRILELLTKQTEKRSIVANQNIEAVRSLMQRGANSATIPTMREAAFDCCISKRAPCHRGKNSLADALILEHFKAVDITPQGSARFFITDNTEDFSGQDKRTVHPDLAGLFDGQRTHFRLNLAEVLNEIQPNIVPASVVENVNRLQIATKELRVTTCAHELDENSGAFLRSRYGGLAWHLRCKKCGFLFDTGEPYDD